MIQPRHWNEIRMRSLVFFTTELNAAMNNHNSYRETWWRAIAWHSKIVCMEERYHAVHSIDTHKAHNKSAILVSYCAVSIRCILYSLPLASDAASYSTVWKELVQDGKENEVDWHQQNCPMNKTEVPYFVQNSVGVRLRKNGLRKIWWVSWPLIFSAKAAPSNAVTSVPNMSHAWR